MTIFPRNTIMNQPIHISLQFVSEANVTTHQAINFGYTKLYISAPY